MEDLLKDALKGVAALKVVVLEVKRVHFVVLEESCLKEHLSRHLP